MIPFYAPEIRLTPLSLSDGVGTLALDFSRGAWNVNSIVFSIDIDTTRFTFDPEIDVRFPVHEPSNVSLSYDVSDSDGEIDILISDLGSVLPEGLLLEIDLHLVEGAAGWGQMVSFSMDPPVSFGDDEGRGLYGLASVVSSVFTDGFESGDTSAWSMTDGESY